MRRQIAWVCMTVPLNLLSLVGNLFLIILVLSKRGLRNRTNILVVAVCGSDMCMLGAITLYTTSRPL